MIAICVESSHQKGMGHLFRSLTLANYLISKNENCLVIINDHQPSLVKLEEAGILYRIVDLSDMKSNWEGGMIEEYGIKMWVNDRMDTDIRHAAQVKRHDIPLITFDDRGSGARLSDLHFAALSFDPDDQIRGRKIFTGIDYLIINPETASHRRQRTTVNKIIVSMGGSDTYGVTIKLVEILKKIGQSAAVHIGPAFSHQRELEQVVEKNFPVLSNPVSLIKTFHRFDLAITGGGVTPFEANGSGLPCIVIASEIWEIPVGRFIHSIGSSCFSCHHDYLTTPIMVESLAKAESNLESMSRQGMTGIPVNALDKIYREIQYVI